MKNTKRLFTLCILVLSVFFSVSVMAQEETDYRIEPTGNTIGTRFVSTDTRWERPYNNDYAKWLLNLQLHPDGHKVVFYNKKEKYNARKICVGVLNFDLIGSFDAEGNEHPADLQQCADACMRIWAEYLWQHKMYDKIHFKNSSGFTYYYSKWAEGYRVHYDKNRNATWQKEAEADYGYTNFRKFMSLVFVNCGTYSLSREMMAIKSTDVQPGDLLIWGGRPGHAVTVMDVLRSKETGLIKVMFSQSFMPAQEIEILANTEYFYSPWFEVDVKSRPWIDTPQWDFDFNDGAKFMRWRDR